MKRGTPEHPKVFELAERLKIPRVMAIGHLELLFHFTAQYAPSGDIGRYSDKRIAAALEWRRDASLLVRELCAVGFLDPSYTCRLVVHDWCDHADEAVRRRLERNKQKFAVVKSETCVESDGNKSDRDEPRARALPCLALPEPMPKPEPVRPASVKSPPLNRSVSGYDPMPGWTWFMETYPPTKINRIMDCQLWISIVEAATTEDKIRDHLPLCKSSEAWTKDGGRFIPMAETYLSKRRFEIPIAPENGSCEIESQEAYAKRMGLEIYGKRRTNT